MPSESIENQQPVRQTERRIPSDNASDGIRARVDELISAMTSAEKAGQLTQYFYFRLPAEAEAEPAVGLDVETQPRMVEEALGRRRASRDSW
jgi:hypothetical protein